MRPVRAVHTVVCHHCFAEVLSAQKHTLTIPNPMLHQATTSTAHASTCPKLDLSSGFVLHRSRHGCAMDLCADSDDGFSCRPQVSLCDHILQYTSRFLNPRSVLRPKWISAAVWYLGNEQIFLSRVPGGRGGGGCFRSGLQCDLATCQAAEAFGQLQLEYSLAPVATPMTLLGTCSNCTAC